jgi:hypothetical protein
VTHFNTMTGWTAEELRRDSSWIHHLSGAVTDNLIDVARRVLSREHNLFAMTRKDFDFSSATRDVLAWAAQEIGQRSGIALLKGVPVEDMELPIIEVMYWGLGLHLGIPRPQGKKSQFISHVRDDGGTYRSTQGRGYNTNSKLDFHSDGSDIVGLLCIQQAMEGGNSMVSHSIRAFRHLQQERPDLAECLLQPVVYSRQGEEASDEPPYYRASIVGEKNGQLYCRYIRNHIKSAQLSFDDIERLTPLQVQAMDRFDQLLQHDDLCYHMRLEQGDIQLLNNHAVLHSRTEYLDFPDPAKKRHLLRLWLSSYQGPALPDNWKDAYKNVAPRSVRGGFKGTQITDEIQTYIRRLADETQMELNSP